MRQGTRGKRKGLGCSSPHLVTLRKQVFHELFRQLTASRRCAVCQKQSATLRGDAGSKIFVTPLSKRSEAANAQVTPLDDDEPMHINAEAFGGRAEGGKDDEDDETDEDDDEEGGGDAAASSGGQQKSAPANRETRGTPAQPAAAPAAAAPSGPNGLSSMTVMTPSEALRQL